MDDETFSAAVLSKLPLAKAVWRVLHFTLADSWLDDLWQRNRGAATSRPSNSAERRTTRRPGFTR